MNNAEGFKVSTLNGVKVYNLTAGKVLPSFISDRQKRNLNKRTEFQHRVQLIQDFEFPTASTSLKMSRNGEFVVAAGCYKPMIRIFELAEMGMKCERYVDSDIVKLEILSDDYSKLILLQSDRTLEVHAKYGRHFRTRIPKFGRDLMYQRHSCEVMVAASGSDVYRLNLELGQYLAPLEGTTSSSFNCLDQSPLLHLVGCGGNNGVVELFDTRTKKAIYQLQQHPESNDEDEITALRFDSDGLTMTCGDEKGCVNMYDLRKREPVVTRQHPYEIPIKAIRYHHGKEGRKLITADAKTIRIWNINDHRQDSSSSSSSSSSSRRTKRHGDVSTTMFTTIEMPAAMEDLCMCPRIKGERTNDSGLIMAAGEQSKIMTFYVPELGPAPKWCRYLENITEELEQVSSSSGSNTNSGGSMYDDYKFVTREELKTLNLEHLIGTALLKGYMHGYFMDVRLYNRSKAVAAPDEFDKWRKKKIADKIESKRSKFITMKRRLPKVNPHMALKLIAEKNGGLHKDNMVSLEDALKDREDNDGEDGEEESNEPDIDSQVSSSTGTKLIDDRFSSLFEDEDFAIDETSDTFRLSNPSGITVHEKALRTKIGLSATSSGIDRRTTRETMLRQRQRKKEQEDSSLVKYQGFELVEDKQKSTRDRDDHLDSAYKQKSTGGFDQEGDSDGGGHDSDQGAFDALLGVREFADGTREDTHRKSKKRNKKDRKDEERIRKKSKSSLKFFEMREGAGDADLVPSMSGRKETMRRAKTAKQKSRLTLSERMKGENVMMKEAKKNRHAQRKHVFSFTPSEVVNQRERERVEKERRKALKREKRGMKSLLPKSNQQGYWKGNKV